MFEVGQKVALVKQFRYEGDGDDWDMNKDRELREQITDGGDEVRCTILEVSPSPRVHPAGHYRVRFDNVIHNNVLLIDGDCLGPLAATEEEIQAAIQSILRR